MFRRLRGGGDMRTGTRKRDDIGQDDDASAETWGRARAPGFGCDNGSALKFTAHSNRRSEPSLGGVDVVEADPLVEALGGSCRHLETPGTTT
jgi:hypothetical protein